MLVTPANYIMVFVYNHNQNENSLMSVSVQHCSYVNNILVDNYFRSCIALEYN